MKKVYIIHGWGGSPDEPMHKWLRDELTSRGYSVVAPEMPDSEKPDITSWVKKLNEIVGNPSEDTVLVGHSIGCQAILRYLETLSPDIKVGGVVLIAPWFTLQNLESDDEWQIAEPWLETKIDFAGIARHVPKIVAIFSDDDPVVTFENAEAFKDKLNTENIIEHDKGHFTEEDGVTQLPSALRAVVEI